MATAQGDPPDPGGLPYNSKVTRDEISFDISGEGVHPNWPDRLFAKIIDSFLVRTSNNRARVGDAMTYILRARELFDFALPIMKAVAADSREAESLKERSIHSSRVGHQTG